MKRYKQQESALTGCNDMVECNDGPWVKCEDHIKLFGLAECRERRLKQMCDWMTNVLCRASSIEELQRLLIQNEPTECNLSKWVKREDYLELLKIIKAQEWLLANEDNWPPEWVSDALIRAKRKRII